MRRLLLALGLVCGLASSALAQAVSYETITVSTTAVGLAASTLSVGGRDSTSCFFSVETADIRLRYDGTNPTSSVGHAFSAGTSFPLVNNADLRRLRMVRSGGSDATVNVTCAAGIAAPALGSASSSTSVSVGTISASGALTHDPDDGTIAFAQDNDNGNSLTYLSDGTAWKRFTFGTAGTASAQVLTVQGIASMTALKVDGSAVTQPVSVPTDPFGANADAASATGSLSAKLRFIASTGIPITGTVTVGSHAVTNAGTFVTQENGAALTALQLIDNLPNTIGSTTSGQSGVLTLGAVTTSAPTYTTAQSAPLSLDTTGALRVTGAAGTTQYAEDSQHVNADSMVFIGGIRRDTTPTSSAGTAGDYTAFNIDANGRAYVNSVAYNSSGTELTQDTQFQQNTAIASGTIGNATGAGTFLRGSAAAPTVVGADDRAVLGWATLAGAAVNQPSFAGVLASTGVGAAGTGVQRMNDTASGTTGSTAPTQASYIGSVNNSGNLIGDIACTQSKIYDTNTNGSTELVAISGSTHIYVCHYEVMAGGTVNGKLTAGTGTACASAASGTPSTGTSGANAALTPAWQLTAQSGLVSAWPEHGYLLDAGAGNALCFNASAGVSAQVQVWYAQR